MSDAPKYQVITAPAPLKGIDVTVHRDCVFVRALSPVMLTEQVMKMTRADAIAMANMILEKVPQA